MANKRFKMIGIPIIIIFIAAVFGIIFLGGFQQTFLPPTDDNALYQYSGTVPATLQIYRIEGSGNRECLPAQREIYDEKLLKVEGFFDQRSDTSKIKVLDAEYSFVTKNVRIPSSPTSQCGTVAYDLDVYRNGQLVEQVRFGDPAICSDIVGATRFSRTYREGTAVLNADFGYIRERGGGDRSHGCAEGMYVVNRYQLTHSNDTLSVVIGDSRIDDGKLMIPITTNTPYHPLSGKLRIRISANTLLGTNAVIEEKDMTFSGSQTTVYIFNVSGSEGTFIVQPSYTLYASTDRLSNLVGTGIFDDTITLLRSESHQRYFIGEFSLPSRIISFETLNERIIINETIVPTIDYTNVPISPQPPEEEPLSQPPPSSGIESPSTRRSLVIPIAITVTLVLLFVAIIIALLMRRR